jgi:hypothetical protein
MNLNSDFHIRVRVVKVGRRKFYVFRWKELIDGKLVAREESSKIPAKRQLHQTAERRAAELEERLNNPPPAKDRDDLNDYANTEPSRDGPMDWEEFCIRFNLEHLSGLSAKSQEAWRTANSRFKSLCNPGELRLVTNSTLSTFVGRLRAKGASENTIATYLRTLLLLILGVAAFFIIAGIIASTPPPQ